MLRTAPLRAVARRSPGICSVIPITRGADGAPLGWFPLTSIDSSTSSRNSPLDLYLRQRALSSALQAEEVLQQSEEALRDADRRNRRIPGASRPRTAQPARPHPRIRWLRTRRAAAPSSAITLTSHRAKVTHMSRRLMIFSMSHALLEVCSN